MATNQYVYGTEELKVKLGKIADLKSLTQALNKACILVENEAKVNCPVGETGDLRRSITHQVKGNVGIVGSNMLYAPYVEYGTGIYAAHGDGRTDVPWWYQDAEGEWHMTSGQHPQPYLEPALDSNRKAIKELLINETSKEIKQYAKH